MNKIDKLQEEINQREKEISKILHKEMDEFKGKFFKSKPEGVVKISITKVLNSKWTNEIEYQRTYFCQDLTDNWWKIDECRGFQYDLYDLSTLQELIEISEEEYNKLRLEVISKAKSQEYCKLENKYDKLKESNSRDGNTKG